MNIVVLTQLVPDLVEELVIDASGLFLDPSTIRWVLNEFDDYAIEQAILLKERIGGQVSVITQGMEGAEDVLFAAAAKGADRIIKLNGDFEQGVKVHTLARFYLPVVQALSPDLILTGVQTHINLDGTLGPILAESLGLPYVGYISKVVVSGDKAVVIKEYPGGLRAEMEVKLPAVLGIQASDTPPRYVPISKMRAVMKTSKISEEDAGEADESGSVPVTTLLQPDLAGGAKAEIIEGDIDTVAARLVAILKEHEVL
jgi:electron transfer flavoprotein beta subunit